MPDAEPTVAYGQEEDDLAAWLREGSEGTDEPLDIGAYGPATPRRRRDDFGGGAKAGA